MIGHCLMRCQTKQKSAIATESAYGTCTWVNFKQEMFSDPIFFCIDFSLESRSGRVRSANTSTQEKSMSGPERKENFTADIFSKHMNLKRKITNVTG